MKGKNRENISDEKNSILLLEKSKKGLLRFIFGHALLTVFLLLAQIAVFVIFCVHLESEIYYFGVSTAISAIFLLVLLNRPINPMFQLSWAILILISPVVGGMAYLIFELNAGSRAINHRLNQITKETRGYTRQDAVTAYAIKTKSQCTARLCDYVRSTGAFPVYKNQGVKYFSIGEEFFEELIPRLQNAKKFIFLEYFIIDEGYMWGRILKILEEKVKEGVEVRVIYDGLCSILLLPVNYPKKLAKLGIKCKVYSQLKPMFSTSYNNRDHRKIAVIDGEYGFTGGINLADEYINRKRRFGHWKDTGVMIQGEAVKNMTLMFLQMWNVSKRGSDDNYRMYLEASDKCGFPDEKGFVLPFGDNPFDSEQVGKRAYLDIINRAEQRIDIMTPYLVPDYEMLQSLKYAAKRGVKVNILMPHIPDKKYVFAVSKTFYPELLAAGVHIYEYTPGFIHAKSVMADDNTAVVGSINFDYRSLYLHFECGVYMYDVPEIERIRTDADETIRMSEEIRYKKFGFKDFWLRIAGAFLKIFSPLF